MSVMRLRSLATSAFSTPGNVLLIIQAATLLALIALAPYAMTFGPFERIYTDGAYDAPHTEDPLYIRRAALIGFGLIGSVVCVICAAASFAFRPQKKSRLILQCSMALCALVIGWRTYPYWVNGIFQVYVKDPDILGASGFDPKPLMPMVWLGAIWWFSVLLLYPVTYFSVASLLWVMFQTRGKKWWRYPLVWTMLIIVFITIITFLITPGYFTWFMD